MKTILATLSFILILCANTSLATSKPLEEATLTAPTAVEKRRTISVKKRTKASKKSTTQKMKKAKKRTYKKTRTVRRR